LGRKSYEWFWQFWSQAPTSLVTTPAEKVIGERFNAMRKVVYSRSLQEATWSGTSIERAIDPAAVRRIKEESVSGVRLDGSISIVQQLTSLRLIDEFRLMVHPVALGSGRRLFTQRVALQLMDSQAFSTGVMLLTYRPVASPQPGSGARAR
jgi:dihydrofolate reductase